jgi:repressor LexA
MNNRLTPKQEHVFIFIKEYISQHKHAPYIREIQLACSIKSHKCVIDRLIALERKGYIRRGVNRHRGIRLVNKFKRDKDIKESNGSLIEKGLSENGTAPIFLK